MTAPRGDTAAWGNDLPPSAILGLRAIAGKLATDHQEATMDLQLSEQYQALQAEIRGFIQTHGHKSPKVGGGRKRPDQKTLDWQKLLVEHGYAGRTIPREYGGFGLQPDVMEAAVIAGEFARANVYAGLTNQGISMLVPTLLEVGTDEQKKAYVGPTIRGDLIWCQGYSEPGNGSDLANAQTKAELKDGFWVVNGQKIWTSSAHYADMMFLLCRTEPEKSKHEGLSYLLLSMDSLGLERRPLKTMTGRNEFNEVFFTDVKVPETQIVLGRGKGWYVANVTLKHERSMIGDAGKMTARLEQLIRLLHTSEIDGTPVIQIAEYRDRLLKLQGEVIAWKAHNLRLLTEAAQDVDSGIKRMIIKYGGTMLGFRLSSLAVDALGAAGLPYETLGEDAEADDATTWNIDYIYDVGLMIGGGSNNIQKNIIGERGLDLPREPKAQTTAAIGRG
jgi:alkylation response protein AidB-like acyl-CoA dehydrogenase